MLMQPERLTFDVPGQEPLPKTHRLVCWQWGDPHAARTVLCVHGLTRNGRDFDVLANALAQNMRVLCPDMPGRGDSDYLPDPAGYNYGTYLSDLVWLLRTLDIKKIDWIGTSMGGILAMMFAQSALGYMRSLILNDVGSLIPAAGLKRIFSYAGVTVEFSNYQEAETALRRICAPFAIPELCWPHFLKTSLRAGSDGKIRLAYDPAIARSFPKADAVTDVDLSEWWKWVLPVPTLVIRGAESDILPKSVVVSMQTSHPNLQVHEVAGAGHAPSLMADKEIALISQWLSAIPV